MRALHPIVARHQAVDLVEENDGRAVFSCPCKDFREFLNRTSDLPTKDIGGTEGIKATPRLRGNQAADHVLPGSRLAAQDYAGWDGYAFNSGPARVELLQQRPKVAAREPLRTSRGCWNQCFLPTCSATPETKGRSS